MTRFVARGASLTLAIMLNLPVPLAAQRETVERHVFVGVTNSRGIPVTGLGAADFTVREDNVAREVLRVAPTSAPSHIALLVDNTEQVNPALLELRTGLT